MVVVRSACRINVARCSRKSGWRASDEKEVGFGRGATARERPTRLERRKRLFVNGRRESRAFSRTQAIVGSIITQIVGSMESQCRENSGTARQNRICQRSGEKMDGSGQGSQGRRFGYCGELLRHLL